MYQLICEGACNPSIADADKLVQAYWKPHEGVREYDAAQAAMVKAQRRLVYTAHEMVGETASRCLRCGHARRYGGRKHFEATGAAA